MHLANDVAVMWPFTQVAWPYLTVRLYGMDGKKRGGAEDKASRF